MRILAFALLALAHAKLPVCPDGYGIAGYAKDWCCKGVCPPGREWTNAEDICALAASGPWPPLCPVTDISLGEAYQLYTWGSNQQGQCGIPVDESHKNLHRPYSVDSLDGNNVLAMALGYQHTLALTYSYQVYVWGANEMNQLGIGGDRNQTSPQLLNELSGMRVRAIGAGGYHSCAVDKWGNMYTWGSNNHGQLGRPDSRPDYALPVPNLRYREVTAVSLGLLHSCAITRERDLYTWGAGFAFQLGHGQARDEDQPRIVRYLQGIPMLRVAAGCEHTIALAVNGSIFVWGGNKYGELGVGDTSPRPTPANLWILEKSDVRMVYAGCHHTAVVTESMDMYMWGWNAFGQLATGDQVDRKEPQFVERSNFAADRVFKAALGYGHTVVMTRKQKVFTFGYGDMGQLGLSDDHNRTAAFDIPAFAGSVTNVAAGGYHSAAISKEIIFGPSYSAVDDPKQNELTAKLKFTEDLEAQAIARMNAPYKEKIRVHVRPNQNFNFSREFEKLPPRSRAAALAAQANVQVNSKWSDLTPDETEAQTMNMTTEATEPLPDDFIEKRLQGTWKKPDCAEDRHPEECEAEQEIADFENPLNEYEAKTKVWYEKNEVPPTPETPPVGGAWSSPKPWINENTQDEGLTAQPEEDDPDDPSQFKATGVNAPYLKRMLALQKKVSRTSTAQETRSASANTDSAQTASETETKPAHHHHHHIDPHPRHHQHSDQPPYIANQVNAIQHKVGQDEDNPKPAKPAVDPNVPADAGESKNEPGTDTTNPSPPPVVRISGPPKDKYTVEAAEASPSPSPRPLIPVDVRRYMSMRKQTMHPRDQLPVIFSADHKTQATLHPYISRNTQAQSNLYDTRHTLVGAETTISRKTQVVANMAEGPATPKKLADDDAPYLSGPNDELPIAPEFPTGTDF